MKSAGGKDSIRLLSLICVNCIHHSRQVQNHQKVEDKLTTCHETMKIFAAQYRTVTCTRQNKSGSHYVFTFQPRRGIPRMIVLKTRDKHTLSLLYNYNDKHPLHLAPHTVLAYHRHNIVHSRVC